MAIAQSLENRPLRRFFRLLHADRADVLFIYVYAIINGIINLALPLGIQAVINLIAGGQTSSAWGLLIAAVVVGLLVSGGLKAVQLYIGEAIQQRIFTRAAFEFGYRIPRFKLESITNKYVPELVNRFFDVLTIQKSVPKILTDFSTSALEIIFGLILLSLYHPSFILFGVVLIGLILIIFTFSGPRGLQSSLYESKYKYALVHWLEEIAQSIATFKLAGRSRLIFDRIDKLLNSYLEARRTHFGVLMFQYFNIVVFKVLITGSLLVLGSILVIQNEINLGQFVAAEIMIILVAAASEKLILSMEIIYDLLTALEKVGSVTDLPLEADEGLKFDEVNDQKGMRIKTRGLSYRSTDGKRIILNNINLDIASGERVCIAGYNGAGKSLLLKILAGLYEDFEGVLTYNDIPRRNLNIYDLRAYIGDHSPIEDVFEGSLFQNIQLGHTHVSLTQVQWAVDAVGLRPFLEGLPKGYDTLLDSRGGNLPKSIIKRIILARSIVSSPLLLAMEKSLVDFERAERQRIIEMLVHRRHAWTLILVSNDPLVARHCDRVLVLRDGAVVDEGTFDQVARHDCFLHYISE